jgi:hypothetical protein
VAKSANVSAERYLVGAVVVSVVLAAVSVQVRFLSFGSFAAMAGILVAADVVVYVLMKLGVFRA